MKAITITLEERPRSMDGAREVYPDLTDAASLWDAAQEPVYKVVKLINSTEYRMGRLLERDEVDDLCQRQGWKVVIK